MHLMRGYGGHRARVVERHGEARHGGMPVDGEAGGAGAAHEHSWARMSRGKTMKRCLVSMVKTPKI